MFSAVYEKLKEIIVKMIGTHTIEQALHIPPILSSAMRNALELWNDMYKDKAPWLKEPTATDPTRIVSLGLPSFIASEKARMATLEMKSEITSPSKEERAVDKNPADMMKDDHINTKEATVETSPRVELLNREYQDKVISQLRTKLEQGVAMGGMVIKPYVVLLKDEVEGVKAQIDVDYVFMDNFYPLGFTVNGEVTEAAFLQTIVDKDTIFRRIEYHKVDGGKVIVRNKAYMSKNTQVNSTSEAVDIGREIPLTDVPDWKDLEPEVIIENMNKPLFAFFKMPEANIIDKNSPFGMSGYGRAIQLIKDADMQYSRLLWEFEATEAAIDIDRDALKPYDLQNGGTSFMRPGLQERLFRKLDLGDDNTYEPFLPQIRDESLINGLNLILTRIEDVCALSRGTIAAPFKEPKNTKELKALHQRSYSVNADIQKALEKALRRTIEIMDTYCTLYNIVPEAEYETSFEWDDSLIVDADEELTKRMKMVQYGMYSKTELRMWYFGESKEQAEFALKTIADENKQSILENAKLQQEAGMTLQTFNNNTKDQQDMNGTKHEKDTNPEGNNAHFSSQQEK